MDYKDDLGAETMSRSRWQQVARKAAASETLLLVIFIFIFIFGLLDFFIHNNISILFIYIVGSN